MLRCILLVFIFAVAGFSASAHARTLHWDSLEVTARLDADGRLHVTERQAYVFSGDWNGGERTFTIRPGQKLDLKRLTRIDPASGESREVSFGSLSLLDSYNWADGRNRLRWRSRLPSDPPFDATAITYELEYTLSNILVPRGDGTFLLDHDFAFPDRPGPILRYTLDLELDPAWKPLAELPARLELERLQPGRGVVLRATLRHLGPGRPAGVVYGAPPPLRLLLVLLPFGLIVCRGLFLYSRERRLGKFAPLKPGSQVTRSWVEKEILSLPPEVVGAAWDDATSSAEVAAVLARMVQEGKLASRVETGRRFFFRRSVLHLELLVERSSLTGYEEKLVRALFFSGTTTDTDAVSEHYRDKGFDPAEKIRKPLEERVKALTRPGANRSSLAWLPTLLLFLAAIAAAAVGGIRRPFEFRDTAICLGVATGLFIFASFSAYAFQREVISPRIRFLLFHLPLIIMAAGFGWYALILRSNAGPLPLTGISLYLLCLCNSIFNLARSRQDAERIALRKNLAAGREFMRRELGKPAPLLEDAWYPYLLAFGLGPEVDRWFRSFAGRGSHFSESVGMSSSGGTSGGFSGGGGLFGGAGAAGSWAAAAGAMAAGVAEPGSSGGSGGGGGGGGSSGGGGGGGW